jgi:hypothetical protein
MNRNLVSSIQIIRELVNIIEEPALSFTGQAGESYLQIDQLSLQKIIS